MPVVIIWAASMAVFLKRLVSVPYNINNIPYDTEAYVKRIGIYYMCIDDLPL